MSRLQLDVVQTSSGSGVTDAARATEDLFQATAKLKQAQSDEEAVTRKLAIAIAKVNEVKASGKASASQLMAAEDKLATVQGKLSLAAEKTRAAMAGVDSAQKAVAASTSKTSTGVEKLSTGTSKLAGKLPSVTEIAGKFAGALGLVDLATKAADAVVKFGQDTIEQASALQQASGAAQAVFGKDYPAISKAANQAATSVGLASSSYQQMAAVLGAGLKNKGLTDYADQTQRLIGLASDLAAQFGGSTQDAVEAIGALMRGEADPIEKYGVGINQAAIDAELLAKGQNKLTGSALAQAQAQARLKLLFDQTAQAQGTFAKESNTQEGAQQRLNAQIQDFQAKVGAYFLPAITAVTSYLSQTMSGTTGLSKVLNVLGGIVEKYVSPIIAKIQVGFANFKASIDKVTGGSEQTQAMLTKVGEVVGKVAGWVGDFVGNQLSLFLTGLGKLIEFAKMVDDAVTKAFTTLGAIQLPFGLGKISDVVDNIAAKLEAAVGWVGKFLSAGGSGSVAALAGLFRSDVTYGGASTGWSQVPLLVPAPVTNVHVNVDGAALRGIIRAEIRATLPRGGNQR